MAPTYRVGANFGAKISPRPLSQRRFADGSLCVVPTPEPDRRPTTHLPSTFPIPRFCGCELRKACQKPGALFVIKIELKVPGPHHSFALAMPNDKPAASS